MSGFNPKIAVLIPCYNEEATVGRVVEDFLRTLPQADIFVFDNNSSDRTVELAQKAGAQVIREYRQGKGNVVRSMFKQVEADVYILADGDCTYSVDDAHRLMEPILAGSADMVVGDRISSQAYDRENRRPFHGPGNRLVRWLINRLFQSELKDILSGYRVFNRFFVKNFPVMSEGFEIETEMTLHALDKKFNIVEIPIAYKDRPKGSVSKLNTFSDGMKIIKTIIFVFKNYKPLAFFGVCSALVAILGLFIGAFPVFEYIKFSYVYKVPSAILAAAMEILAMVFLICGIILDTTVRQHRENYELHLIKYFQGKSAVKE